MKSKIKRLYFIDGIRAWAILMMLQGHFVSRLLDSTLVDKDNFFYSLWVYFKGITAPVFFAVSGFIFTFILLKNYSDGLRNPRVRKGLKRGLQLIFIGHLLQYYFPGIVTFSINNSFFSAHVLQCIGLSIILIVGIYLISYVKRQVVFSVILLLFCVCSFLFKSTYSQWDYSFLPQIIENYFTLENGSSFTIFPWFGYASFGAFLAVIFSIHGIKSNFYPIAIAVFFCVGGILKCFSFRFLQDLEYFVIFKEAHLNSYLFNHLGDVLIVFSVFMLFRSLLERYIVTRIGSSTLSIYLFHSVILYGSFTGFGLSKYYRHSLTPVAVIIGAIIFLIFVTSLALVFERYEQKTKKLFKPIMTPVANLFIVLYGIVQTRLNQFRNWIYTK